MKATVFLVLSSIYLALAQNDCSLINSVTQDSITAVLKPLAQGPGFTKQEKAPRVTAIRASFNSIGLEIGDHQGKREGITIIGKHIPTNNSTDSPIYILCAHYDTVSGTIGMFDNTLGMAAVLEAARVLAPALRQLKSDAEVWFVAWDNEEGWMQGSGAYVNTLSEDVISRIAGVWNTDSMGGFSIDPNSQQVPDATQSLLPEAYKQNAMNDFKADFLAIISDNSSVALLDHYNATAAACGVDLKIISFVLPVEGRDAYASGFVDFCRSDHLRFWEKGVAAVHLTDTYQFRNACYHHPCENWSLLKPENWDFTLKFTNVMIQDVYNTLAATVAQ